MTVSAAPASIRPPKQARSQRTLDRIVAAALEVLATEGAAGITVQAVVTRAGSSVGSFYARFKGKDDLLAYLEERVWHDALQRWEEALRSRDWTMVALPALVEGGLGLLVDAQRSRSTYLKALDAAVGRPGGAYLAFRSHVIDGVAGLLLARREEITHESPELAVRLSLKAVLGVIEAESNLGSNTLERATLVGEGTNLVLAYLTGARAPTSGEGVDFFDVWG